MDKVAIRSLVTAASTENCGLAQTTSEMELPICGNAKLSIRFFREDIDSEQVIGAVYNLTAVPASFRNQAETLLYKNYQNSIKVMSSDFESAQAQLDWESETSRTFIDPVAAQSAGDIWALIQFHSIYVKLNFEKTKIITIIEADCAWDGEHGVTLFFDNGKHFIEVNSDVNAYV